MSRIIKKFINIHAYVYMKCYETIFINKREQYVLVVELFQQFIYVCMKWLHKWMRSFMSVRRLRRTMNAVGGERTKFVVNSCICAFDLFTTMILIKIYIFFHCALMLAYMFMYFNMLRAAGIYAVNKSFVY